MNLRRLLLVVLVVLVLPALAVPGRSASFQMIPGGGDFTGMGQVGALSPDGSRLAGVGWSTATWSGQGFSWSTTGGVRFADTTLPLAAGAWGVSSNGQVVAGWRFNSRSRASCWVNGTLRGVTATDNSSVSDVSRDGTALVGGNPASSKTTPQRVAARWTVTAGTNALSPTSLGDLPGGATNSEAVRISGDGSTIVGWGTSANGVEAFRYRSGVMTGLGDLPGGRYFSEATAVSSDGSVVVGRSDSASGPEAFRWTSGTGMTGLGDLAGGLFSSAATGVSGDGAIVVGTALSGEDAEVFVWDQARGMRSLAALCAAAGMDVSGWRFSYCRPVISENGEVIAGDAIAPDQTQVLWRLAGVRSLLGLLPRPPVTLSVGEENVELTFQAHAGFVYQVQVSPDLATWQNEGAPIPGDGTERKVLSARGGRQGFWRLVVTSSQ